VPELVTQPAETRPAVDEVVEPGEPANAHIVKVEPGESAVAKVLEARIYGTPVEALCGFVWVPSRDPKQLPLCEQCKSIYELYQSLNDDLPDSPDE
jgi:Na+-translocating ferredoxin:NAD+ oxidoreductase RnfC subunit